MEDQVQQQQFVGMADLRQLMNGRAAVPPHHFQGVVQPPADFFSGHRAAGGLTQYEMMMVGVPRGGLQDLMSSADTNTTPPCGGGCGGGGGVSGLLEMSEGGCFGGGDGGNGRWPRQETLTLLEIRSRLDSKFKEANQKGPLWDEVSRIMSEEHGYQRSGKKCREKFENLYKYYKKTKEGKAGRQDGKHYRFFRQLEALYGDTSTSNTATPTLIQDTNFNTMRFHTTSNTSTPGNNQDTLFHSQKLCDSLSLSNNSSYLDTTSSDDNDLSTGANDSSDKRRKRRGGMRSWKVKIKEFIDSQMRKLGEKQEEWLDRLTRTLEQKEQERLIREEEWRKQEASRIDREHKFWAKERAWIEARDNALMEALQKVTGLEVKEVASPDHGHDQNGNTNEAMLNKGVDCNTWQESEITRLIELRSVMEPRFQQSGGEDDVVLWEEISTKMAQYGYERSTLACKDKWESINDCIMMRRNKEVNNKRIRKENSSYFQSNIESLYNQGGGYGEMSTQEGSSPSNASTSNGLNVNESCIRFLMNDGANINLWENYGLKLSRGGNQ
ncbi:putative Duplicated homeodomain-like superfamily protein [Tripterygium wilfordii]|uniref:Putative Duplicated homeodomain-like superfamily protein n=1 Tax=Tripterygium wilfordii TaxID=458696 RepID=A0A7J7DVT7_TRIWF|nr:trihelix transcription factor PTL [Tripterygium wilfordii]KAF5750478.1 putative Duplicated homeodomain-like superfamily protein [Tripterygium wilfordii]